MPHQKCTQGRSSSEQGGWLSVELPKKTSKHELKQHLLYFLRREY